MQTTIPGSILSLGFSLGSKDDGRPGTDHGDIGCRIDSIYEWFWYCYQNLRIMIVCSSMSTEYTGT